MVGQLCSPTAFTVQIEMQGTPLEAVVDTGAEVTVPSTEVHDRLEEKPPCQEASDCVSSWGWRQPEGFHSWPL